METFEFVIKDLRKSYFGQTALDGVTLSIIKGSMNFLLGANGSGKSTLLKCLSGHQHWDSGTIFRNGKSRDRDHRGFNEGVHLISEDMFPPLASLADLSALYSSIYASWDDEVFQRFLSLSGLDLSQNLTGVSRGQKIQAIVALALATRPQLLLIDEATAVLDPYMRNRLMVEIEQQNKKTGVTVVIATNLATELTALQGRLLIMQKGRIVIDRKPENVSDGFVKIRVGMENFDEVRAAGFSLIDRNEDGTYSFLGTAARAEILKKFKVDQRSTSIEEIFIFYSERRAS